jgi:dipeptidyl-peptidase-4
MHSRAAKVLWAKSCAGNALRRYFRAAFLPMKKLHIALLALALTAVFRPVFAQKSITLEDCFTFYKFYPESGTNFQYLRDGARYVDADKNGLHVRDVRDAKKDSVIALLLPEVAKGFDQFVFSDDESKLLLRMATEQVYRHSVLANYFVYDFKTGSTVPVFEGGKQQFAAFSPDGSKVAFVSDNNLFIKDLSRNLILKITTDGAKNRIINGVADWVYEEEFSPVDGDGMVATKWSPDGSKLAYIRFDESEVPEMPLTWYEGGAYPRQSAFKYPKVGAANSAVSVHIHDLNQGDWSGRLMGLDSNDYCPRIHFTENNELVISRLNRNQDTLELLLALPERAMYDAEDETNWIPTRLLLRETDAAYVELESENKLVFLKDKKHFLWTSERSGWQHIYLYPTPDPSPAGWGEGRLNAAVGGILPPGGGGAGGGVALTSGNFDVTAFYGVDEPNGKFYYQTATPTPLDRQVWEGDLKGGAARLLTPTRGTHEASFSPTFDYYTHVWSDANTPPVASIVSRKGDTLRVLTKNERVRRLRQEYGFVEKAFFTFDPSPDGKGAPLRRDTPPSVGEGSGAALNGWILRPAVLDSTKKYPVLFDNYGGPGSQTVQNQYDGYLGSWHQMLVQKGYVIVSVDNRGTGARGRDFKKCTQLQLGKYETEDQIAAARYLATLPWVDAGRMGIWGWSFGGYLSTSCILKGNDVFKMAMAVAPVTNWKWYDSAYTERYMRTTADNARGYEENSPVNFADRLRGSNYLICHGIADDNVHWQQTVEMINALVKANKQFETYYYPNRNHGIYGQNATRHLFTKLTAFVLEKL